MLGVDELRVKAARGRRQAQRAHRVRTLAARMRMIMSLFFSLIVLAGCTSTRIQASRLPIPLPELDEEMSPAEKLRVIREFKVQDAEAAGRRAARNGNARGAACWPAIAQVTREKQALIETREPITGPLDAFEALQNLLHPQAPPDDRVAIACDAYAVQVIKHLIKDARQAAALASSFGATGDYMSYAKHFIAIIRALRSDR